METANIIIVYAWVGWAVIMLPTIAVLCLTSWVIAQIGNTIYNNLKGIYKLECIDHYFDKMEKEGTHAFKNRVDDLNEQD